MKTTILLTIMAMSLALGTSRANTQTGANKQCGSACLIPAHPSHRGSNSS